MANEAALQALQDKVAQLESQIGQLVQATAGKVDVIVQNAQDTTTARDQVLPAATQVLAARDQVVPLAAQVNTQSVDVATKTQTVTNAVGAAATYQAGAQAAFAGATAAAESVGSYTLKTGADAGLAASKIPLDKGVYVTGDTTANNGFWVNRAGVLVRENASTLPAVAASVAPLTAMIKQSSDDVETDRRMRLLDGSTPQRVLADVDPDASVGLTWYIPVKHLPGSIPKSSLDLDAQAQIPFSLTDSETVGYLMRLYDANRKLLLGVPTDGSMPLDAYVSKAAYAESAPGSVVIAANTAYLIEAYKDAGGITQLRSRRRTDDKVTVLTNAATSSVGPYVTPAPESLVIYSRDGVQYTIPAAGGTEAPLFAGSQIALCGDSMTAPGSGYSDVFIPAMPTRTIYLSAEGGEKTDGIAVSFGIPGRLFFTVAGNSIPTSGSVAVTPSVSYLSVGICSRAKITCADGTEIEGTVARTGANMTDHTFTPLAYPGAAKATSASAAGRVTSLQLSGTNATSAQALEPLYRGTVVIRAGRNNVSYDRVYDQAQVLSDIAAMVALCRPVARHVFVLGVTNGYSDIPSSISPGTGAMTEVQSATTLNNVKALNTALAAAYPDNFLDPLANHIALGGGSVVTVNGQTFTVLNTTVLSDGVHENTTGKTNTSNLVQSAIVAKGY